MIKYWLKTDKGICLFYNEEKKSCHIYPVRPLVCRIHPVQFYLNNDPRTNLFNINSNCLAIERKCKEITSNIQNNDYAVIGEKKSFLRISNYIEYDSFRNEKLFAFFYVWRDFFMDPIEVTPERVKGYERHDMSHFWNWLSEHRNEIGMNIIRKKIRQYKDLLSKLNQSYNFNIKCYLE